MTPANLRRRQWKRFGRWTAFRKETLLCSTRTLLGTRVRPLPFSAWVLAHLEFLAVYWADNGRDILNLIISYIDSPLHPSPSPSSEPSLVTPTSVPSTFLSPVADPSTTSLQLLDTLPPSPGSPIPFSRIFRDRLIVGIGHSLGGAGMAFAATASPSLFSSIIFCDPVLPPSTTTRQTGRLVKGAVVRRETWKDREEAKEGFLKKPFFRAWDSRVLDKYIQYGLKDTASGEVALKARARDEAVRPPSLAPTLHL